RLRPGAWIEDRPDIQAQIPIVGFNPAARRESDPYYRAHRRPLMPRESISIQAPCARHPP
ncbi:MAG: hypothetical protein PVJ53_13210, partial [Desulfobacterales bacterium]